MPRSNGPRPVPVPYQWHRLRLPAQRFDSAEQLAFADRPCVYTPWHSLPAHKAGWETPTGARKQECYWELARLRQAMTRSSTSTPTGEGAVPGPSCVTDVPSGAQVLA